MVRIVTYDFVEFVESTSPEYPVRYEVRQKPLRDGVTVVYLLRVSGVDHRGNVIEFREKRVFRKYIDDEALKRWLSDWNEVLEKLGARPGRYLPR